MHTDQEREEFMRDYADLADGLTSWFISQEVTVWRAVGVMGYLIGVMAAEAASDPQGLLNRLDRVNAAIMAAALLAYDAKGRK